MSDRPNIIFIFSDQQRWDTLGCYGQKLPVSPNLDAMAAEGTLFWNAFSCQPVCGPARSCLQTGKYPTETGCWQNGVALPPHETTMADELREGGYAAGYIGKWHLASTLPDDDYMTEPVPPERRGGYDDYWQAADVLEFTSRGYGGRLFDGFGQKIEMPDGRYRADFLGDLALDFLETRDGERPFFLFLSFIEPHHQNDLGVYQGPDGSKERWADFEVPPDLAPFDGDWRENYPDYLGCCASLDDNVGRIRAHLADLGLADNTVLVYTSDHGSHFRTRNAEYKRSCHDASLRVPLIIHGPGFTGGGVRKELASLIDLPPTVLRMAGLAPPERMQGRPLQDLLEGNAAAWRNEIFFQISESGTGRGIRTPKWKYAVHAPEDGPGQSRPAADLYEETHLYDLAADPHELRNLAGEANYRAIARLMRDKLTARMAEAGEALPEIVGPRREAQGARATS